MVLKEMCCGGIWDGITQLARMTSAPSSFFVYLKAELEEESEHEVQYNKLRHPKKHVFDNFAAFQVRMHSLIHQIHVLEEWELGDNVCKICSNSFGVGLTVSVPTLQQAKLLSMPFNGTVWMKHDHQVRIITTLCKKLVYTS
jgi:hypothetical protein